MARKKEIIQREWDPAQTRLTLAISEAEKAIGKRTVTKGDVDAAGLAYTAWKKLLDEAVKKIGEWKNEKDKDRLDWMKFVNTQKTKTDKNFETKIAKVKDDAAGVIGGNEALAELILFLKNSGLEKLKDVDKALKAARAAIEKKDSRDALHQHGIALNQLKGVTGAANKSMLKKQADTFAKNHGATGKDVDFGDGELVKLMRAVSAGYVTATMEIDELDDAIGKMAEDLAGADPETDSSDSEYKAHLKECMGDYKSVVDFASGGLGKVKKHSGDIAKLKVILSKTVSGNARAVVPAVLKVHAGLKDEYGKVDTHIQQTLRLTTSTFQKKATDWKITPDDRKKNLLPLMNRAFSLNYQCKGLYENGTDRLVDIMQELITKFDNAEAKSAISKLD